MGDDRLERNEDLMATDQSTRGDMHSQLDSNYGQGDSGTRPDITNTKCQQS